MKEYELDVLEQYDIDIKGTRKIRGAILCDTAQGLMLLREAAISDQRIPILYELYEHIEKNGYPQIDQMIKNKEDQLISRSEDGKKYVLKRWFVGKECDIRKENELLKATKNLAVLHKIMKYKMENEVEDLQKEYLRHNRELNKIRSFVRKRTVKGEFETAFLQHFEYMFEWAGKATERLGNSGYKDLLEESKYNGSIVHGDYNYHNTIMTASEIATTNFEHFKNGIQAEDLYYFLRKTMEKNNWNEKIGADILKVYQEQRTLTKKEMEYIALRLAYPEKFWKLANAYYYSNKAWIPVKNVEKLQLAAKQMKQKQKFLENIFTFHL
ncbi:MAG: CotS family spore coat protein [Lachnospiraceae bacterium]